MPLSALRSACLALLSGALLSACGGIPEQQPLAPEEGLGTQEAALCSGLSVSSLTVSGVSTYLGEMAGSGNWTVSSGANAVRLEYLVDGAVAYFEERVGASGTWYFSQAGISCGTHSFQVRGFPMVIDSAGNRTTCSSNPKLSTTHYPSENCPIPTTTLSCSRYSSTTVRCTGTASQGSAPYTPYWQEVVDGFQSGFYAGSFTQNFYCPSSCGNPAQEPPMMEMGEQPELPPCPTSNLRIDYKVKDAAGTWSAVRSSTNYICYDYLY